MTGTVEVVNRPGRNSGPGFQNTMADERGTYAFGIFKDAGALGDNVCDDHNSTGRVTGLPWKGENGDLLHIGAGASLRKPCSDMLSFSARPVSHLAELDTGGASDPSLHGHYAEASWRLNPNARVMVNYGPGKSRRPCRRQGRYLSNTRPDRFLSF